MTGENTTCASPWYQAAALTGFIMDSTSTNFTACSFYRYFESPGAMKLKVSQTISYQVGFR